ncbi:glycerophosphodiester phosphodiesterase [Actinomadura alba]|uniref:Glycerophosphodiester phosphodiesterase n=1 Tax=Actinomadura alba TaxID=406431 RepID=A0ABR7LWP2_9ACTN|nr:glycerophosphodiester phosphodiesterase family protein [Actinomadura alba]MBC6469170.1 glycerophosphodiester phosphodiesterase [Actinomadura alba]
MSRPFRLAAVVAAASAILLTAAPATAAPDPPPSPPTAVAATTAITPAHVSASVPAAPAKVVNVAHRGASAYAPENTMAAFRLARTQRADMFELDVQETRDHELVLMHDTTLARTTNVEEVFPERAPWQVADFELAEIRRLDAGSWFGPGFQGEPVPTLGEALREMRGSGLGLLLEIKAAELYPGIEHALAEELRRHPYWLSTNRWERRLVVQSFNWQCMRALKGILPWVPVGLLGAPAAERLPRVSQFADQINPPFHGLTAEYVAQVHALRMDVFTWSVQDPAIMRQVIAHGVDGVITDRPDILHSVLAQGPARSP